MVVYDLNCDTLRFKGHTSGYENNLHIISETDGVELILGMPTLIETLKTKKIQNNSGETAFDLSVDAVVDVKKAVKFESAVDFNSVSVSGLTNLSLNSSQILSSNLAGQSGDTSIDAEIDSMTTNITSNTNRTSGLTANRIMRSNNAGNLQIATFDTADVLRKNDTTDQAITSNLNFASGKKVLYNGNQIALSDISGYTALQDEVDVNSAKTSITSSQASAIIVNTAKVGITTTQRDAIIANTDKVSITTVQRDAIIANTDKTGITSSQASAIIVNTAKVGITTTQRDAIIANTDKVSITTVQRDAIIANTDKTGITSSQASAIITNTAKVALTSGEYSKIQALPSVADINALAHTNDTGQTFFDEGLGVADLDGNSVVLETSGVAGSRAYLSINSTDDTAKIILDQDVDGGGFVISNNSGNLGLNTNINLSSGKSYKINGTDLNFSDLGGTVANSQIASGITGSKISGVIPTTSVPSGLNTSLITAGQFDSLRIPSLPASKIGSGTFVDARIPTLDTSKITSGLFNTARIPSLPTSKITSGAFVDARIPDLATSKITSGTFVDARIPNLNASKITSGVISNSQLPTDIVRNTTDIIIPNDKHIYRAKVATSAADVDGNNWITIAVLPATSSPFFGYTNSTFSILDSNRKCFGRFTISIIKASHTINVDIFAASTDSALGIAQIRLLANSAVYDGNHRQGALLEIYSRHSNATYTLYEHAGGNYIENGFSLITPQVHSSTQTNYTQISSGSTISVSSPSGFTTVDSVVLEDFQKDYTDDHSDSSYDADFVYRCGANAYFKRRIVLETTAEDIYQTHANTSSLSNGVFTRLTAIENGKDYTANTITFPNNNSRIAVRLNTNDACALAVGGGNTNCNVWQMSSGTGTGDLSHYGFSCKYMGAGTGNNNSLRLIADNQGSTEKVSYEILQDGKFLIHQEIYKTGAISSGDGLFERMSAIDSSPTWVAITPASGYETGATTANTGRLEYSIVGKQVFIRGEVKRTGNYAFTDNQVLFVLPSAIRPKYSFYAPLYPQLTGMLYFYGTNQDSTGDVTCTGSFNNHLTVINVNYLLD